MARFPGLYRRGNVWWCKYYVNGRPVRESTGTEKETEAKRFLDAARGRLATGQPTLHLDPFFDSRRVTAIDGAVATAYVEHRQRQRAANGTISRELAVLVRARRLGYEHAKVTRLPVIHKLPAAEARQGFFELDTFLAVRRRLEPSLQVAVTIAHTFGWRMKSEVPPGSSRAHFRAQWRRVRYNHPLQLVDSIQHGGVAKW